MSKVKVKLNRSGVANLLKSEEMQSLLLKKSSEVQSRCGDGYEQDIYIGKKRANAMVKATSFKARRDNAKRNTLLKALR